MEAKFDEPLEWWVDGTPDSVEAIFRRTAEDLRRPGFAYSVENSRHRSGVPTLTVREGREVVGFCFTSQDGNALVSSVAAATWFVYPESYDRKLQCLQDSIFDEI